MITGKPALIYDALMTKVGTLVTGSPTLPVSYPEPVETFVPPTDGKYIEVIDFTNQPAWEGLASGVLDQGILQLTVIWPKNAGLIGPKQVVASIKTHFAKATRMVSGSVGVKVTREPWAASPIIEADKVRIPITIFWTA